MIEVRRFQAAHLQQLQLQPAQAFLSEQLMQPDYVQMLAQLPHSFTAMDDAGRVLASAGVMEMWHGRCVAWALLADHAGPHMRAITRAAKGFLVATPYRRVEAWVDDGFDAGHRWMQMLGFELETPTPMQGFRPDGGACFLYARVK